jgi:hypothetical protein
MASLCAHAPDHIESDFPIPFNTKPLQARAPSDPLGLPLIPLPASVTRESGNPLWP